MGRVRFNNKRRTEHNEANTHMESVSPGGKSSGFFAGQRASQRARSAHKFALTQQIEAALVCTCKSGLKVISKKFLNRKWVGYCKKCQPTTNFAAAESPKSLAGQAIRGQEGLV